MKKTKVLIIVLLLLVSSKSFGLDTNSIKYMPLHVGDYWVYNSSMWYMGGNNNWISKCSVTSSVIYNNHLYYYLSSTNSDLFNGYFRVDSITGSLYKYDPNNSCIYYYYDKLYDSLSASVSDTIRNCATPVFICTGTIPAVAFGDSTYRIAFNYSYQGINSGGNRTKIFLQKYGLYSIGGSSWGGGGYGGFSNTLKGCKLNGISYGDTTLTSMNIISSSISAKFILSQNYPNPFNPVTKIRFDIQKSEFRSQNLEVTLKIYDALGRDVETLVNEQLAPGTYEATFDGSSLNSGVYFYKLSAGDFSETKRMVLLK